MPNIILLVDTDGRSEVIVKGIAGSGCTKASEFLTNSLGTMISDTNTEEYACDVLPNQVQGVEKVNRVMTTI